MGHIKTTKGLDIPIIGKPTGYLRPLSSNGQTFTTRQVALNLDPFEDLKFKLLVEVEDRVKIGQPLLEDKSIPGLTFASPAGGIVKEIRRGAKRAIQAIVIETSASEEVQQFAPMDPSDSSRDALIARMMEAGLFPHIRRRPFNLMANPLQTPRSIFVKAVESAPFAPSAEIAIQGYEQEFQAGLDALQALTDGSVHLVYRQGSPAPAFTQAQNVEHHTVEGPHPIANPSLHIHAIDPINRADDLVWTVTAYDAVCIGHLLMHGKILTEKVISIAGEGILPDKRGFFRARQGIKIEDLMAERIPRGTPRLISGDPLTGTRVEPSDFLGFNHNVFCVIPESDEREFLHFFRLGSDKYSATGAYFSGHLNNSDRAYHFTTSLHGEPRAFVTSTPYEKVMPMPIPTMELVKAVMAEDYELAETLGLLEVDSEDFALPTFVDPSKIEMVEIIKNGLKKLAGG
jgi:Na+-transporting NADH:ubiquinone oxidoreductase subunit A